MMKPPQVCEFFVAGPTLHEACPNATSMITWTLRSRSLDLGLVRSVLRGIEPTKLDKNSLARLLDNNSLARLLEAVQGTIGALGLCPVTFRTEVAVPLCGCRSR